MKKILYSALVASTFLFASCDKDYLETQPTDAVSDQAVFTTTANAWAAINGIHRSMFIRFDSQGQPAQSGVMIMMDMLGEDLVMTAVGNRWFNSMYQWQNHTNVTSGDVRFVWRFYYKIIANANMIISNIDNASGPEAEKNAIKGQAYVYRAWAHHQLVQIFAKRYVGGAENEQLGVPYVLVNSQEGKARETVAKVYELINQDLDEAIVLLGEGVARTYKSHFDVSVAKGIKARVALTMQDWANAAKFASEAREGYSLMSNEDYMGGFSSVGNPEWMWGSDQITDQTTYFASFFAYMSVNFSSTNIRTNPKAINSALYDQIPDTDIRKQMWDPTPTAIKDASGKRIAWDVNGYTIPGNFSGKPYMNRKFLAEGNASSVGDVPYMRAAEMYLIEAEALARIGGRDAEAALLLHNLVSSRDAAAIPSVNLGQDLIEEILTQRRIELWGEGFRFLDLKRLDLGLDRTGANHDLTLTADLMTVEPGVSTWQWLIPQDEMNANPLMVQNPLQ